jgi:prevent-host-death family protein
VESVQIRDAKAKLLALIEAAERGRPTTITRHGRPAAVLVPVVTRNTKHLEPLDVAVIDPAMPLGWPDESGDETLTRRRAS